MQVRDEVCGMRFDAATAAAVSVLDGRTYYFCAERCRRKFEEHPDWYVNVRPGFRPESHAPADAEDDSASDREDS